MTSDLFDNFSSRWFLTLSFRWKWPYFCLWPFPQGPVRFMLFLSIVYFWRGVETFRHSRMDTVSFFRPPEEFCPWTFLYFKPELFQWEIQNLKEPPDYLFVFRSVCSTFQRYWSLLACLELLIEGLWQKFSTAELVVSAVVDLSRNCQMLPGCVRRTRIKCSWQMYIYFPLEIWNISMDLLKRFFIWCL